MIIWGSRGVTSTVDSTQFHCPQCNMSRSCGLKEVRNYFTLYFIPIIPLNVAGRYVECSSCGGTFAEEALNYDPQQEQEEVNTQMLRVMVMAALADGMVDDAERSTIQQQYQGLAGLPVAAATLESEIAMATSSGADLNAYVAQMAHELSPHGAGLVVTLAYRVMSAGGQLKPGHQAQLNRLAGTLQIPQDQFAELVNHLMQSENV